MSGSGATGRAAIAGGHPETVAAAAVVLSGGGTAFDAVVAAAFTASVVEPLLTSPAGGGFCLVHRPGETDVLVDFFVDVPGRSAPRPADPHDGMTLVTIDFTNTQQDFWCGWGSIAVPGNLRGWLHLHRRFGRLDLHDVLAPAIRVAREGVVINDQQAYLFRLLTPILALHDETASRLTVGGRPVPAGHHLRQPVLADWLSAVADDPGGTAAAFDRALAAAAVTERGGRLGLDDLAAYEPVERRPASCTYRGRTVVTNPAPSEGGRLIAAQLEALDAGPPLAGWDDPSSWTAVFDAQLRADRLRRPSATRGTTHTTVADAEGNVAAMTTSNGSGSGCSVPGTGVMLNNILGEDDLFPDGLGTGVPGARVASMMSPTMVHEPGGEQVALALGSGGSKRIRTAITQVIARFVDHEPDLAAAVSGPRLHFDGETVQIEPVAEAVRAALADRAPVNQWAGPDLYFGGVHAVVPGAMAAGDPRRGGSASVLGPAGE